MPLKSPQWSHALGQGLLITKEMKVLNHCLVSFSLWESSLLTSQH